MVVLGGQVSPAKAGQSTGQRAPYEWTSRSTGLVSLAILIGCIGIGLEHFADESLLENALANRLSTVIDSMALGIAFLGFAALGARNRAEPDHTNLAAGCMLAILGGIVLPVDLVFGAEGTTLVVAVRIASRVALAAIGLALCLDRPAEKARLGRSVVLTVIATLLLTVVSSSIIEASDLDGPELEEAVGVSAAILLVLTAFWIGASGLRRNDRRSTVLAFALVVVAIADGRETFVDGGQLAIVSSKWMRLCVIAALLIFTVIELRDLALRDRERALLAQGESERAADRLVAQLSYQERFVHDTRNALLAIQGGLSALASATDNTIVDAVSSEVDRLRTLLEIQESPLPITFDMVEALRPMVSCYSASGTPVVLKHDGPVWARGRPSIAAEVTQNLIENAIVHSGSEVVVWVFTTGAHIEVRVADRGQGIDENLRETIFDHGVSGGSGSGVGLHISRRLVEQHGGELIVTDRYGGGSIFTFCLPAAAPHSMQPIGDERVSV